MNVGANHMGLTSRLGRVIAIVVTSLAGMGCASSPARPPAAPTETYSRAPGAQGSALLYLPGYAVRQLVQFEVINGMAVRGGDVMLGPVTHLPFMYGMPRHANVHSAVATASTSHLWPGGDIPFEIDGS